MPKENKSIGWERNTDGIKAAAQRKRQEAFARTEEAIKKLLKEKCSINFESVAEAASVTRAWLYKQPDLRSRIETLRQQQSPKRESLPQLKASDKSKDTFIIEIRKQNKELRTKIQQLNKELEIVHGRALGIEDLQQRITELEQQNRHLFNLLTQARAEIDGLRQQGQAFNTDILY
jgi:DNA repair exonuclease SbcCD ATPase subunit